VKLGNTMTIFLTIVILKSDVPDLFFAYLNLYRECLTLALRDSCA